ncbi:hypothetical protein KS527_004454 [Salmonella enterica]|nr:hypothetical protein [Salmonella enterica]EHQ9605697.1 hypothetical protein [Salmonella enterica]
MKRIIIAATLLLSGCSTLSTIDGGHPVDCTAYYTGGTFGINQGHKYPVHISRMRTDRFGREFVRADSNLDIKFMGGYKNKETFTDYQCK